MDDRALDGVRELAGLSRVLRGLRIRGDEVQLARVLALLAREPTVARHLLTGILSTVTGDAADALLATLPERVQCLPEQAVSAPSGRGVLRRRARAGRVDLEFRADAGWHLLVELKIDAPLADLQINTYARVAPSVAVVRVPEQAPPPNPAEQWLGAVAWEALLPTLQSLPLPPRVAAQWLELLAIIEQQGDFAPTATAETGDERRAHEILTPVQPLIIEVVTRELKARNGANAGPLSECLGVTDVAAYRGRWSGFELYAVDGRAKVHLISVLVRDALDQHPTVVLEWYAPEAGRPRRARKTVDAAIEQLVREDPDVKRRPDVGLRWQANVEPATLASRVEAIVARLVRAGAFELDVANWEDAG